ncbi:hypothetical protein B1H19_35100 [Streptomyces gilvosporeus]|uniref:Helicase ATP-binding domain-containing protein n=1 Tax=Streptomyces gilvosporeus TaxID=553510 RepID=A0A1V0U0N8_9ACTN|nr:hypothetical protein B1H19_35100 [Streptomyces gilvosporeus]
MAFPPDAPPAQLAALTRCAAVFLPSDPPRAGRIAFWRPDGEPVGAAGPEGEVAVALPDEDDVVAVSAVPAVILPVAAAVPVLTRARASRGAHPAAAFWGAACVLALQLAARGRLLPGLTADDHDAWRLGPLDATDLARLRDLAAAMPPYAHATPLPDTDPLELPKPERHLRAFLDAVADGLPRTPAAALATEGPAFAAQAPQRLPGQRAWAADVAAGHDAGVRISLRVEVQGMDAADAAEGIADGARFTAVLQVHSPTDPALVADAAEVWAGASTAGRAFGPRARMDTLLALRRAAAVWPPLTPLLSAAVPDALPLADEEIAELLGSAGRALAAAGVEVHWPRQLTRKVTGRAVVGPLGSSDGTASGPPSLLSAEALLSFSWRFAVGDQEIDRAELERLAEAGRPLVRLRDQWVLLDPEAVRAARDRRDRKITPLDALGAALTGTAEDEGGERVAVAASGWLAELRDRLADPERPGATAVRQPAALAATLRDYQLRGLSWLHRMTSLGLGCTLADDMGLGKTITLISLHLHRQTHPSSTGPTLVVCPTSLMGNWQREIETFAPGTPVRRYHAGLRSLADLAENEFVLTTYGTMRRDAARLAAAGWGLVVADLINQQSMCVECA